MDVVEDQISGVEEQDDGSIPKEWRNPRIGSFNCELPAVSC